MNSAVYQSTLESDMRPSVMAKAWIELGQDDDQNRLTGKKQKSRFCNCLNCCSGKGGYESCAEKNAHKEAKVINDHIKISLLNVVLQATESWCVYMRTRKANLTSL